MESQASASRTRDSPHRVHFDEQQFARIRPLNDLGFAARRRNSPRNEGSVPPVPASSLAYLAAIGMLTMKGMVESLEDPLAYSDDQVIEGFARVFEAAAAP